MKRIVCLLVLTVLFLSVIPCLSAETTAKSDQVTVSINGTVKNLKQPPVILGNLVFIPMREIFIQCGYDVKQDTVITNMRYKKGKTDIIVPLYKTYVIKNGLRIETNNKMQLVNGNMFITPDMAGRLMDAEVSWDSIKKTIVISTARNVSEPYAWAKDNMLIAHGLGAINGATATNSLEALEYNYQAGYRVFEIDLAATSDDKLVAVHDWDTFTGFIKNTFPELAWKVPTHEQFKGAKFYGYLTPLDFTDIANIMSAHKDIYIVTDTKSADAAVIKKQFEQIVNAAKSVDESILKRIIPQLYSEEMLGIVNKIHKFDSYIYTLYMVYSPDYKVVDFAVKNNIKVVTMAPPRFTDKFIKMLAEKGIYIYLHTINSMYEIENYRKKGARGFYSDFVTPNYIKFKYDDTI